MNVSETVSGIEYAVDLESVITTAELSRRRSRAPNYAAENRALVALAQAMATSPEGILQELVENALELCQAQTAGISLLEPDGKHFYWPAITGQWASHVGGGTPREYGPCGTVLDRNAAQLMSHVERHFAYFAPVRPWIEEVLLVPFYVEGKAVGTIWVIVHDQSRRFDGEDLRVMTNLGAFAAAAYQTLQSLNATKKAHQELQQTTAALRRGEQELRDLVENASIGMHWVGSDGIILWANRTELEMLGYTREEYIGHHIGEFHAERLVIEDILQRLSNRETLHEYEARLRCKDGSIRHMLISSNTLWEDDKFVHTRCFTRDITERKRAEAALRERECRLRDLIEALPAAVYTTDAEGRITMFNQAAVEFSGRVPELGTDAWCVCWKLYWPDGTPLPHDQSPMAMALKEGRVIRGYEAIAERPDGTRINFIPYPTPLRDGTGKLVGAVNMLVDITERKRMEEARATLAAIVESSDDAIISKDLNSIITSWNGGAERLFGYTAEEAIGQSVSMLIPADRIDEEPGILERIRRGESINHYETVRRCKDGTLLDISLTVSPIADTRGQIVGASKTARDITERKRAESALREANERLNNQAGELERLVAERTAKLRETIGELEGFSYSIAHDMRAPLRGMAGFATLLMEEHAGQLDPQGLEYLRRIAASASRLDQLIQDVLSYSKVLREVPLVPVNLDRLTRDIISTYPEWQPPEVDVQIEGTLPKILGNEAFLTQCISNLVANAVKFVADGTVPRVTIRAESNDSEVRVWFEDNGIGIAPENRSRIFGMFTQLHGPGEYGGTGIGLSIVRKAVERMRGRTGFESELGKGSRFWIELQKAPATEEAKSRD